MATTVNISIPGQESELKQLEILDGKLNTIYSNWIKTQNHIIDLESGLYLVKVIDLQGEKDQLTIEVDNQKTMSVDLKSGPLENEKSSRQEKITDSLLSKKILSDSIDYINVYYSSDHLFRRIFEKDVFTYRFTEAAISESLLINTIQKSYPRLAVEHKRYYYLISLPVNEEVTVLVKKNLVNTEADSRQVAHELKFTIHLKSTQAEGLLRMLTNGDITRAESLFKHIDFAKQLLYDKIENPTYASLGGYFLLRSNALEQMRHWPENLANWFEWLPDGCIIHATQQMRNKDTDITTVRRYFLMAYNRGIPQFTEGLKLLHEGLMRLFWIAGKDDYEVKTAYENVGRWMEAADLSNGFTIIKEQNQ